jgi:uncharacterized membrane protein YkvA (DUF1232 family)
MPDPRGSSSRNIDETAGLLAEIFRNARLIFRLLGDPRIPPWLKAIPIGAVVYILSPIDLLPDFFVGLGQLDDIAILLLAVKLFLDLSPQDVVTQHQMDMASAGGRVDTPTPGSYVDATFTVLDEEQKK